AATDWVFDNLGWTEVIHTIDPANVASKAVAQRLGSTYLRQGRLPAPFDALEVEVWGQSREQWQTARATR
ncbi:MAG: GNAT family protein, partial [Dokdonella sp.]